MTQNKQSEALSYIYPGKSWHFARFVFTTRNLALIEVWQRVRAMLTIRWIADRPAIQWIDLKHRQGFLNLPKFYKLWADLEPLAGPRVFGYVRQRKDWVKFSWWCRPNRARVNAATSRTSTRRGYLFRTLRDIVRTPAPEFEPTGWKSVYIRPELTKTYSRMTSFKCRNRFLRLLE